MKYSELDFASGKKYRREPWAYDAYVYLNQEKQTLMLAIAKVREVIWICESDDRIQPGAAPGDDPVEKDDWVEYTEPQPV